MSSIYALLLCSFKEKRVLKEKTVSGEGTKGVLTLGIFGSIKTNPRAIALLMRLI